MNRIKQLRNEKGWSQKRLSKEIGASSQQLISLYELGENEPSIDTYILLSEIFEADIDYIAGKSNIRRKQNNSGQSKKLLPVLGTVKAGYNYLAQENVIDYIDPSMNITDPENYFVLKVKGDSMSPLFDENDYLVVQKTDTELYNGDICVVLINGDEATVKKVVRTKDCIELHAYNPYYPVKKFTAKEVEELPIRIIGTVVRLIRNFK